MDGVIGWSRIRADDPPPGGASGLLVRDYKGKEADQLITRIAPGVVSLVAELRGHERQAPRDWTSGRPAWGNAR
jgi:hypothetical protein